MTRLPDALAQIPDWRARRARAGHLLIALDFDGTLAPIVPQPDEARAGPGIVEAIAVLTARGDTEVALVSGRGLADLRSRLDLPGLYYAGNHGLEIEGPGVHRVHPDALAAQDRIQAVARALQPRLEPLQGVQLENKTLSLSIHYRRAVDVAGTERRIAGLLQELTGDDPRLRLTPGKRVVEVRPRVDWDKGRATRFLLESIERGRGKVPALFIGDDVTDEDAFALLAREGIGEGILVAERLERPTAAGAVLESVAEVREFLHALGA